MQAIMSKIMQPSRVSILAISLGAGIAGCGGDSAGPGQIPEAQLFWSLEVNEHAVTFAIGDTIYLHATALNPAGDSLPLVDAVQYQAGDSSVSVTANGLVTAMHETVSRSKLTYVIASVRDAARNLTLEDTVFIQVTSTRPSPGIETFALQPSDTNTARSLDVFGFTTLYLAPTVLDSAGTPMSDVVVTLTSTDRSVMTVSNYVLGSGIVSPPSDFGQVQGVGPGTAVIHAEAWVYGVSKRDSIRLKWENYISTQVLILSKTLSDSLLPVLYFYPQVVTVAPGGVVTWSTDQTDSIDVVFDDPTHVDSAAPLNRPEFWPIPYSGTGNFSGLYVDTVAANNGDFDSYLFRVRKARRFTVPGTYNYHSVIYGSTGKVVVQ